MNGLLLVALGGALGSVLRFGLGNAGAALFGTAFPWPTIAINVLGSAAIGFVAAASTPDGALPDSLPLRLLLMTGFCGGFTTFSSFSLQSLDLLREQRPLAALANAGFSMGLCLAAVAAGSAAGTALDLRALSHHAARLARPGGTAVLAVLDAPAEADAVLDAARALLAALGRPGRVEAIAFRASGTGRAIPGDVTATERVAESAEASRAEDDRIEALARRLPELRVRRGRPEIELAAAARRADFLVLARPAPGARPDLLHAALFDTARPVLVVPPGGAGAVGRSVAIAWTGDRRVRAAVRAALPLLARARQVAWLRAPESPPIPAGLPRGRIEEIAPGEGEDALRDAVAGATDGGADLVVMGAAPRGRVRDRVLGDATARLVDGVRAPLLLRG